MPPTDPKDLVGGGALHDAGVFRRRCRCLGVSQRPAVLRPFSFYEPPVFFSLAPKCGPENGGGIVSVGGIGLGSGDALACRFGETPVLATMHTDGGVEQLRCASPTLAVDDGSTSQSMLVALNGQQFESAGEYHVYSTPVVSAVLPGSGLLSKSTGIVISGRGLSLCDRVAEFSCRVGSTTVPARLKSRRNEEPTLSCAARIGGRRLPAARHQRQRNRLARRRRVLVLWYPSARAGGAVVVPRRRPM